MTTLFFHSLFILLGLFSASLFSSINGKFLRASEVVNKPEKLSHLHFYFHDVQSGKNQSVVQIINPKASSEPFGATYVMDDPLTMGRDPNSKPAGKSQGLYSIASQKGIVLFMVANFVFEEGIYNGSSISILGRNAIMDKVRELPIVGGTGLFRFARGYALAHTLSSNSGNTVVEYNVYVLHY